MSAYIVDTDTIDYLAAAMAKYHLSIHLPVPASSDLDTILSTPIRYDGNVYRCDGITENATLARLLYAQNVRSVDYRYREESDLNQTIAEYDPRPVPFHHIDPVVLLKSIACVRYQSCETPNYRESVGYAILSGLERHAINALKGYSDAPWGWTRATVTA